MRRPSDRLQSIGLFLVIVGFVAALPFGVFVGQQAQHAGERRAAERITELSHATAVLLENAAPIKEDGMVSVQASWRAPTGAPRRGQITVPSGLMAGARVNIWVDAAGEQRLAPPSVASVRVGAVISGVAASASVVILLVWLQLILVWTLNRKRYAAWAKEWERVGPRWRY